MAADDKSNREFERLNAMVDGELSPAERSAVADRLASDRNLAGVHATLARLKAAVGGLAADAPAFHLPVQEERRWRRAGLVAASIAAVAALSAAAWLNLPAQQPSHSSVSEQATIVSFPALPPGVAVPRLDMAGLKLTGVSVVPTPAHLVTATYRGPHGCRLDLRAAPAGTAMPYLAGNRHRRWQVGDISYDLVAHGMPAARFDLIAEAAEWQTRQVQDPRRIDHPLRQAGLNPPPCVG
jgi:hypothetical protein